MTQSLTGEIVPGIWRIEQRLGDRWLYLYLVQGTRPLLVDTGIATSPESAILPALARWGIPPGRLGTVLITHPDVDHFGGNAAMMRAAPQAELIGHVVDRPWLESRERILAERYGWYAAHDLAYPPETMAWIREGLGPDTPLTRTVIGGEWLDLGGRRVQVLHLPGHSPGHLGLWEPDSGTAIIGDAVLERGLYDVGGRRISPPPYFATAPYLQSIAQLEGLAPEHLLTAHYPALHGADVGRFLDASRAFVGDVAEAVAQVVQDAGRPISLKDVTAGVVARVGPFDAFATELAGPVRAHLDDLVASGVVVPTPAGGWPGWRWTGA
ncbi:MAG: MBL fold metallo-hydrolase [Chloroflexota bacterium]|nr:MBL fold metallo-hydrolase [Chloroflexota bacterium]